MALARVVTFDGVDKDRIAEMKSEMEGSERPEGIPAERDHHPPRSGGGQIGRDRLLRERERLQGRRRGTRCDADRRHAGHPHVGHEVRRRDPHEGVTDTNLVHSMNQVREFVPMGGDGIEPPTSWV